MYFEELVLAVELLSEKHLEQPNQQQAERRIYSKPESKHTGELAFTLEG